MAAKITNRTRHPLDRFMLADALYPIVALNLFKRVSGGESSLQQAFTMENMYSPTTATQKGQNIYLYPLTPFVYRPGSNDYILRLKETLEKDFKVVNNCSSKGMVELAAMLPKVDIIYFNWIEDLADKKLGYVQIILLLGILLISKFTGKKIVWFVHNELSHRSKNRKAKLFTRYVMKRFADVILSHARQSSVADAGASVHVFEHPVDKQPISTAVGPIRNDILIWGSISAYKGVMEFIDFNRSSTAMQQFRIVVAGKFDNDALFEEANQRNPGNIQFINRVISEEELSALMANSRFVLFSYTGASVLSSGALCRTLGYRKTVIGPYKGSFADLADKGLVFTYRDFEDIPGLVQSLIAENNETPQDRIDAYMDAHSWSAFGLFLRRQLMDADSTGVRILPNDPTIG